MTDQDADPQPLHLTDVAHEMHADDAGGTTDNSAVDLPPFGEFNVVAAFSESESAREALLKLERAGIDGSKLSFLGLDASDQTIDERTSELDHAQTSFVARGTAKGGSLGTVGGAALGGALMLIPGIGPVVGAGVLGAALGGGFFGGVLGGIWGGFNRMGASAAWEETFHEIRDGLTLVGVHTDDRSELERAREVLEGTRLRLFDRNGNPAELNGVREEVAEAFPQRHRAGERTDARGDADDAAVDIGAELDRDV